MNTQDNHWQNLVALSAPSFKGAEEPPFGFTTQTMARWREQTGQCELVEKIGLRALFASVAILVMTAGVALTVDYLNPNDLDPGMRSLVQVENVKIS